MHCQDCHAVITDALWKQHNPPSSVQMALGIDAFRTEDSEGWNDLLAVHTVRHDELLAAVEATASAEAVQAIIVNYSV